VPTIFCVTSVVRDMARTLDFYRLLGLEIPPSEDGRGYVSVDPERVVRLAWTSEEIERPVDPTSRPPTGSGRLGLAFRCDSPDAVDATFRTLVEAGHRSVLEPVDARWGARLCRVIDPDGNTVDVFAPLP
jgi:catechol 2,3-dioxygenase-like lactoylglutathione lyase family enzyme